MTAVKYTDEVISQLAKDLLDWAAEDSSTALCQFLVKKKLAYNHHYYFMDKHAEYKEAAESIKPFLAMRLRDMLENSDRVVMMELGHYDKEYHNYTESIKDAASNRTKDVLSGLTLADLIKKIKNGEIDISNYEA